MTQPIEELYSRIQRSAGRVAEKWPGILSGEDLAQDIVIHLMARPGSLEKLGELEEKDQLSHLKRIGWQIAASERTAQEVFSGNYSYAIDEVRTLLERNGLHGHVDKFEASVEDLRVAFEELRKKNRRYYDLLFDRYYLGKASPKSGSADAKALQRAVDSLTLQMNRINQTAQYEWENGGRFRNNRKGIDDYDGEVTFGGEG